MKLRNILLILILIFTVVFLTNCQNKEVSIKFDTGDQEIVVNPIVGKPGETVIQPRNPNRIGHRFLYWSFNGEKYEFSVLPKKSITLVAVWEAP
ncbi:MAG: InlB B-repeat-containing protein, partial [Acholeplasmataceae bacterium]|nr:InlB B-repeat-containing protein [Acholeplasmataceae bacterium]